MNFHIAGEGMLFNSGCYTVIQKKRNGTKYHSALALQGLKIALRYLLMHADNQKTVL